jgi:hypothetical protein
MAGGMKSIVFQIATLTDVIDIVPPSCCGLGMVVCSDNVQ